MSEDLKKLKRNSKKAATLLKTLAHPDRLLILCQLVESERCVGELLKNSALSQSAFSQHLSVLRNNNTVSTRKEAQTIYYSISDKNTLKILEALHQIYCS
jgi:DNA-binding transcriptional ArsR family regulator